MNNSPLPGDGVTITLDKPRTLRMNLGAFRAIRKATGKDPLSGNMFEDFDTDKALLYLWAALLHEDKTLTPEQASEIADTVPFGDVLAAVREAFILSMPVKKEAPATTESPASA